MVAVDRALIGDVFVGLESNCDQFNRKVAILRGAQVFGVHWDEGSDE